MKYIKHRIELIKLLPPNPVAVEVGVAEGMFSRDLLEHGVSKLYSVDNWGHIPNTRGDGNFEDEWHQKNYEKAISLLTPFGERSVILRGMSMEMAKQIPDNSLDLFYHDANHSYEGVKSDLEAYWPKVKLGGVLAGHDYLCTDYQVKQAVDDFILSLNEKPTVCVIPETHVNDAGFYFIKL